MIEHDNQEHVNNKHMKQQESWNTPKKGDERWDRQ